MPSEVKTAIIPFLDLKAQYAAIRSDLEEAIQRVLESQQFILGPEVEAFEAEAASAIGARHAISCASGSDALLLSLTALGAGPGDEIVTTPFTFVATAGSIARAGAKPVFVDTDESTFNLDPNLIEPALSPRTRAVLPVHMFGLPASMERILELAARRGLAVIEDAAQAIGARYRGTSVGTLGECGCFSFFPSKNLGGAGDGGMIATNDSQLAERLRLLRAHGSREKYHYEVLGMNSRLDALQAAILRVKLRHLEEWNRARREKAQAYRDLFAEAGLERYARLPSAPPDRLHTYHQFVLRCPKRDELRDFLYQRGVCTGVYYPSPLHLEPAFAYLGYRCGQFPQAESASREVLALPIYPELKDEHQARIVRAIAQFYGSSS